ncbi:MAG: isocitrate lyase/phosphoenolpyruvate mutase family protein [Negativicutes bacterium]|nr:isocitrate lyase/phosphoenolpyruvate mutase family protein [Negativicutes bacterium]
MTQTKVQAGLTDLRRGRLKRSLAEKSLLTALEAHSGPTGLIAEKTSVCRNGKTRQFDAIWCSSLCDATLRGKPDIGLVDFADRLRTLEEIMDVTTKPIIYDADTGGLREHFAYPIRTLERLGVSAVIIEDKTGLKINSLCGTGVAQTQDSIANFCSKLSIGKAALQTTDFLLIARTGSGVRLSADPGNSQVDPSEQLN